MIFNNCEILPINYLKINNNFKIKIFLRINKDSEGIVPLSLNYIFNLKKHEGCDFALSFLQIYMEEIRDLLNPDAKNLTIFEDFVS